MKSLKQIALATLVLSTLPWTPLVAEVVTIAQPAGAANVAGGIAVAADGRVYSAEFGGSRIFRVDPETGSVEVFATGFLTPSGNAFDSKGLLYQSNYQDPAVPSASDTISVVDPDGNVSTFAEGLRGPVGIAIDEEDILWVAMCNANSVVRVDRDGSSQTVATGSVFNCPNGITFDDFGNLWVVNFNNGLVVGVEPDGTTTTLATVPGNGNGHVTFISGWLYITARVANQVYRVSVPDGKVEVVAGSGIPGLLDGPPLEARFAAPNAIGRNALGNVIYTNENTNAVRRIELELARPKKPKRLRVERTTNRSVTFTWVQRSRNREGFVIEQRSGGGGFEPVLIVPSRFTEATIKGLSKNTTYLFRVRAFNGTATSRPSRKLEVTPGR